MSIESDFDADEAFSVVAGGRGERIKNTPDLARLYEESAFDGDQEVEGLDIETVAGVFEGDLSIVAQEASYDELDEPEDDIPDLLEEMGL